MWFLALLLLAVLASISGCSTGIRDRQARRVPVESGLQAPPELRELQVRFLGLPGLPGLRALSERPALPVLPLRLRGLRARPDRRAEVVRP